MTGASLTFDWKRSVLPLFKGLVEALSSAADLEDYDKTLTQYEPARDLLLLFELAICANLDPLVVMIARKLEQRKIKVPVEIWLRIAVWPGSEEKRITALAALVHSEPPSASKFVCAMLVAMGEPQAFARFFAVCPQPTEPLTPAALQAIMSVAWESSIVQALSNSWIDDVHTGFWVNERLTSAERHEMRKSYVYWTTMLKAQAAYRKATPNARTLDTSCFNYMPAADQPRIDSPYFAAREGALFAALNEFAAERAPPETPIFVPARQCDDTEHLICTLAIKKKRIPAAVSSAGSSPPKGAASATSQ